MTIKSATLQQQENKYTSFEVDGKVRVVHVESKEAVGEGVSIRFGVGTASEPFPKLKGLAHFAEHIAFLMCRVLGKNLMEYIASLGGMTNAYTSAMNTTILITVGEKGPWLLRMFLAKIIDPTIDLEKFMEELKSIQSEYEKDKSIPGWQDESVKASAVRRTDKDPHPFIRFGCGNKDTLKDVTAEDLITLYKMYLEKKIFICYLTQKSYDEVKDELLEIVENLASHMTIKEFAFKKERVYESLYGKTLYASNSLKEQRLEILWELSKEMRPYYNVEKGDFKVVSTIIGDKRGLFYTLKNMGLIVSADCGLTENMSCVACFSIVIELTSRGMKHISEVLGTVNRFLEQLPSQLANEKRTEFQNLIDILRAKDKFEFEFGEESAPFQRIDEIINLISRCTLDQNFLRAEDVTELYTLKDLEQELKIFDQNCFYVVTDHTRKSYDYETEFMKVKYSIGEGLKAKKTDVRLSYPVYRSKFPEFVRSETEEFEVSERDGWGGIYIINAKKVKNPTMIMGFKLRFLSKDFPEGLRGKGLMLRMILGAILNDLMGISRAEDILCMRNFSLMVDSEGISSILNCSTEDFGRVYVSIAQYINALIHLDLSYITDRLPGGVTFEEYFKAHFEDYKDSFKRNIMNLDVMQPYEKSLTVLKSFLLPQTETKYQCADILRSAKHEDFSKPEFKIPTSKCFPVSLIYTSNTGKALFETQKLLIEEIFGKRDHLSKEAPDVYMNRQLALNGENVHLTTMSNDPESSVVLAIPLSAEHILSEIYAEIIVCLVSQAFFTDLRTIQQLGYIVNMSKVEVEGMLYLVFLVQSGVKGPEDLELAIHEFIDTKLEGIIENGFQYITNYKKVMVDEKSLKKRSLADFEFYWREIINNTLKFDRREKMVLELLTESLQITRDFKKKLVESKFLCVTACGNEWRNVYTNRLLKSYSAADMPNVLKERDVVFTREEPYKEKKEKDKALLHFYKTREKEKKDKKAESPLHQETLAPRVMVRG